MTVFLEEYADDFKDVYYKTLEKNIKKANRDKLLSSLNSLLNKKNQFGTFRDLILADHNRLRDCVDDIKKHKRLEKWQEYESLYKLITEKKKVIKNLDKAGKDRFLNTLNSLLNKNKKKQFKTFTELINDNHNRFRDCLDCIKNKENLREYEVYQLLLELNNYKEKIEELKKVVGIFRIFHGYYDTKIKKAGKEMKLNLEILKTVHVCPYCNRDYINERGNKYPGGHLDHFFPRSQYPFFAICLYNLIPCCAICNTKKKEIELTVSPFKKTGTGSNFEFKFELEGDFWNPKLYSSDHEAKTDFEILGLQEAYNIHKNELTLIAEKRKKYSKLYEEHLSELLEVDSNSIYNSVEDLIFGEMKYYDVERYKNTPLSYLKHQFYTYVESVHEEG